MDGPEIDEGSLGKGSLPEPLEEPKVDRAAVAERFERRARTGAEWIAG